MSLRVAFFFLVLVLVMAGASTYVARRAREAAKLGERTTRVIAWTIFLGGVLPLVRFAGSADAWVEVLATIGFGIALTSVIGSVLMLGVDTIDGLSRRIAPASKEAPMPRREAVRRIAIGASVGAAAATTGYGIAIGRHDYQLEEVSMRLARLPRALDGYTIAQLSDVHLGTFVGRREIAAARELVLRTRADLVVLTGDLVDHDPRYLPDLGLLVRAMSEAGARDGVVAILGNHDDYTGADAVVETLRAAGVRVLRNDAITIGDAGGRFALLGVDDVWAQRNGYGHGADLDRAMHAVDPDLAKILLCHNPSFFPEASARVDLQLSGHTHGGQFNPIVRPADLILPYVAGRYVRGDAQLYVNRGFGTAGPPARIGSPPEVTRIVLASG